MIPSQAIVRTMPKLCKYWGDLGVPVEQIQTLANSFWDNAINNRQEKIIEDVLKEVSK